MLSNSSRTELDSHANMPVLGRNARVIDMTGETVDVKPFSSACNTLQDVPIVDAVVKYNDKVSGKSHLLLIKNGRLE